MMEANPNRVHFYHADVTAFGGHLITPIEHHSPIHAPLSLPPVGGHAILETDGYKIPGILSFDGAYTQVAGSVSEKDGAWTTIATSVVRNVNIHDILTADKIVSQIIAHHPPKGYEPKVSFLGTRIENLRVSGCPVEVKLDYELCNLSGDKYPEKSCFHDDKFLKAVGEQRGRMKDDKVLPAWTKNRQIPEWVHGRYAWDNSEADRLKKGFVLCSLVKEIRGEFPGRVFGHVLEIPEFGKVFLEELIVDNNSFRVIGMRLELGCASHGTGSFSAASIEGRTQP
jgi:hypothetical protein